VSELSLAELFDLAVTAGLRLVLELDERGDFFAHFFIGESNLERRRKLEVIGEKVMKSLTT
jgi:hypothetical protein